MELYVVRHGETEYNAQGRYCGILDIPLNKKGFVQAHDLATRLSGKKIDIVISSPMIRAKQTAEIVCTVLNLRYIIHKQLAERSVGVFEGLTHDEAMNKYPNLWVRQPTKKLDDAPDGGETLRHGCNRIDNLMTQLRQLYENNSILVICHAFVSQAIHRYCKHLTIDEMLNFSLNNCEFIKYTLS